MHFASEMAGGRARQTLAMVNPLRPYDAPAVQTATNNTEPDTQLKTDILASAADSKFDLTEPGHRFTIWRIAPHVPILFGHRDKLSDAFSVARREVDSKDLVILDATRQEIIRIDDTDREKPPA